LLPSSTHGRCYRARMGAAIEHTCVLLSSKHVRSI